MMDVEFATVLVVEDEKAILELLKLALSKYGFDPILVGSGEEAVDVFRQRWEQIAVVLMDVKMPGLDGPETLSIMREINPAVCCCFMSGYPGKFTEKGLSEMGTVFLWKPFGLGQVADSLRRLRKIFCQ